MTGTPTIVVGALSTDNAEISTAQCPSSAPYGAYAECRLEGTTGGAGDPSGPYPNDFVYRGTACGNGIANVSSFMTGTETGSVSTVMHDADGNPPVYMFNDTSTSAGVFGADMGSPFFSDFKLHFAFGDSKDSTWNDFAHSTLANVYPVREPIVGFLPGAYGVQFTGWHGVSGSDHTADQVIPNQGAGSPIPGGGWAITENGHTIKYLWFTQVTGWSDPIQVSRASIAYQKDNGPWRRLDANYPTSGVWWDANKPYSNFSAAATYQQIIGVGRGYIYIYGYNAIQGIRFQSVSGVALARVKATESAISDKSQYEYWNGTTWIPAYASDGSDNEARAVYIVPPAYRVREGSISYNSYANRYMMMTGFANGFDSSMMMLQSETLTGPWTEVSTDLGFRLGYYAPMTHDRMQFAQGQAFVYLQSEATPVYNVGAWYATVTRNTYSNCKPGDPG